MISNIKGWFLSLISKYVIPYKFYGLFVMAFAESSFFPIPPDLALIPLALSEPSNALYYALVCTIGSVLGGCFGYLIGKFGGRPILIRFVSSEKIDLVYNYFEKYNAWAVGIAGFTPLPYKVFTISAGMFQISFLPFLLASIVSRGGRFFLVGGLIFLYGEKIKPFIENNLNILSILFVVLLVLGFYSINIFSKKVSKKDVDNEKIISKES